jgi:hypothetical protein
LDIKVKKRWTSTTMQSGKQFNISASIGFKRYKFLKDNGIHISTMMREMIDNLMARQVEGEDIFKRIEGTDLHE